MQTADFLARVVPPGHFLALAINREPGTDKPRFYTRMFKDTATAASYASWAAGKGFEVFQAQASYLMAQPETNTNGSTYYKGSKEASNVAASRAFYVDLDVHRPGDKKKPGETCFATRQDAAQWLSGFITATKIPKPSSVVDSGYGYHPYWLVDDPLKPADWLVIAHALRAAMMANGYIGDAGITTDIARILRTPGTVNLKVPSDPKTVAIKHSGPTIANSLLLSALQPWIGQAHQAAAGAVSVAARGTASVSPLAGGGPALAYAGSTTTVGTSAASLQTGVTEFSTYHRYEMAKIATKCGQVQESLRTRGNGDSYPLWYTGLLSLAGFTPDGADFIGPLSDGDPRFSQANLDAAWGRVQQERIAKPNLGPPLCTTLEASRPSICAACPHRGRIKTPLVLGRDDNDIPAPYRRGPSAIEVESTDEHGHQTWLGVVPGDITDFRLDDESGPPHVSFSYHRAGRSRFVRYSQSELLTLDKGRFQGFLSERGIQFPHSSWSARARDLLMAWVNQLAAKAAAGQYSTPAFGWVEAGTKIAGFAVGGRVYASDGTERSSSLGDGETLRAYGEVGSIAKWRTACDLVVHNRPEIAAIVAASFGSPLIRFTGQSGVIISAISRGSGVGKTSGISVGQAVWGHPVQGTNNLNDTMNSAMARVAELRSLPLYWDELRGGQDNRRFVEVAFQMSSGRGKGRLSADLRARGIGTWQTMLIAAANEPLMEHVIEHVQGTEAGALRVFEYMINTPPLNVVPGASSVINECRTNYGGVGRQYAKWLAANHTMLQTTMTRTVDAINAALGARNDERFYVAAISCMLQGALIANSQGYANFQTKELKDFLFAKFHELRRNRARDIVATAQGYDLEALVADFMGGNLERRLITDKFGNGKTFVKVLQAPPQNRSAHVQVSVADDAMRINRSALNKHLRERNISHQGVVTELERQWGAIVHKAPIGTGTPFTVGHTWVIDIPMSQNGLGDYAITYGDQK